MAYKTMLRQLISKWGIMSIELQTAIDKDMAAIHEDGTVEYVDNMSFVSSEPQTDSIQGEVIPVDPSTGEVIEDNHDVPASVQDSFFEN